MRKPAMVPGLLVLALATSCDNQPGDFDPFGSVIVLGAGNGTAG